VLPIETLLPDDNRSLVGPHPRVSAFNISALGVLGIPRLLAANRNTFHDPLFFNIKHPPNPETDAAFLIRNFGAIHQVVAVRDALRDVPTRDIEPDLAPEDFLKTMLEVLGPTGVHTPTDLSALYVPRQHWFNHNPYGTEFHLVVGDSPYDVIYAKNRRLVTEPYLRRNTLWLSSLQSQDSKLLDSIGEWVQRYYCPDHQTGKVVSYSVASARLQDMAKMLQARTGIHFTPLSLPTNHFPCPTAQEGRREAQVRTQQISLSDRKGMVEYPKPPFVRAVDSQTGWMVDLDVQHDPERHSYTNIRPFWRLPRRLGLADLFFNPWRRCRMLKNGLISGEVAAEAGPIGLSIPRENAVFNTCFAPRIMSACRKYGDVAAPPWTMRVSSDGKCLRAVLGMFGSLFHAGDILRGPFWRRILCSMAGMDKQEEQNTAAILKAFGAVFSEDPSPLQENSPRLASLVQALSSKVKLAPRSRPTLTQKGLRDRFNQFRSTALKEDRNRSEWQHYDFKEQVLGEIDWLLSTRVLLQGCELSCGKCGSRNWFPIGDMDAELTCPSCSFTFSTPASPEWSYRLNALVSDGLRRRGMLAVILTLNELEQFSRSLFLHCPCQDVFKKGRSGKFTDLDILVVSEGRLIIGEVKSTPGGFKKHDLQCLETLALCILPDEVLLSAIGVNWPPDISSAINEMEERLHNAGVALSKILLVP